MRTMHVMTVSGACLLIMALLPLGACAPMPNIIGTWQGIGTAATLALHKDGTFHAVDDMEMAVSGTYALHKGGRTRFEIINPGSPPEIVWGRISVQGDELMFASDDNEEVYRYQRTR